MSPRVKTHRLPPGAALTGHDRRDIVTVVGIAVPPVKRRVFRRRLQALAALIVLLVPLHGVQADDAIDPSLIPDGTYPAHVDRVIDARHLEVTMQGTLKILLASGRPNITFSEKLKSNDEILVSLTEGKVTAFAKKAG